LNTFSASRNADAMVLRGQNDPKVNFLVRCRTDAVEA
jgi:hypothetical protein